MRRAAIAILAVVACTPSSSVAPPADRGPSLPAVTDHPDAAESPGDDRPPGDASTDDLPEGFRAALSLPEDAWPADPSAPQSMVSSFKKGGVVRKIEGDLVTVEQKKGSWSFRFGMETRPWPFEVGDLIQLRATRTVIQIHLIHSYSLTDPNGVVLYASAGDGDAPSKVCRSRRRRPIPTRDSMIEAQPSDSSRGSPSSMAKRAASRTSSTSPTASR